MFAFLLLISTKINVKTNKKDINQLTINGALTIGLWQTLSIISGASRWSGTVITGSLFLGYRPEDAAKFSIYLSIPTLLGAMFLELLKMIF